jgi:SMC interacting uncharacterized protein involved in chromosome segregation
VKNFELYRGAAARVRKGWARDWRNDKGGVCLVQSILDQRNNSMAAYVQDWMALPNAMVAEIDATLQQYGSYQMLRRIGDALGRPRSETIMMWNDFLGTQHRVAKALDDLADEKELEFLRSEQVRLQIEVQQLKTTVENLTLVKTSLEARVTELQDANGWLRRSISYALAADRRELEKLDGQLDDCWVELTRTQKELTSDRFARLWASEHLC